jgi:TonB family protein
VQAAPTTAVSTSAPEPAISTPVPTVASTPSVVAKEHAPLAETKEAKSHASEATKLDTIATPIHLAEPASKPAPITLAAGHSMKSATRDDADVPSPAAPQLSGLAVPVAPSVALPAANELPKLTAQVAKTWTGGTLIRRVAPVYPAAARTQGLQGAVELRFVITRNDSIDKLRVVNGNPVLARAAMEAVQLWRYDPFKADGVPMDKEASITLNFTIPR